MPRSEKNRIIKEPPLFTEFKPRAISNKYLEKIELSLDEYEAIRLADHLSLSHAEAADEMNISRPTFSRLIEKARKKMADFIISGKALHIQGGNVHFRKNILKCTHCNHMFNTEIDKSIDECPKCDSDSLMNLAAEFGHGRCCKRKMKINTRKVNL